MRINRRFSVSALQRLANDGPKLWIDHGDERIASSQVNKQNLAFGTAWCWRARRWPWSLLLRRVPGLVPFTSPSTKTSLTLNQLSLSKPPSHLTLAPSLVATLQKWVGTEQQGLWRGPDWNCQQSTFTQDFPSTSDKKTYGYKIRLVVFVLALDDIWFSVLFNTELCPCPGVLCWPDYVHRAFLSRPIDCEFFREHIATRIFLEQR